MDRSPGAAKYLDELLTWRELSHVYCTHQCTQALHSLAALPAWARTTLREHAGDARVLKTGPQMEQGATGDAFWDAAQQQLVRTGERGSVTGSSAPEPANNARGWRRALSTARNTARLAAPAPAAWPLLGQANELGPPALPPCPEGELHNNCRMTWGKAPLAWTPGPEAALRAVLHLNHRHALDGCNPCSYGGVMWCFGMFDGPKEKEGTRVSGALRRRPTAAYARRLNVEAYRQLPA